MFATEPTQVFHTTPNAELLTQYPLALVPAFLVPLAFTLHIVSLLQLSRGTWYGEPAIQRSRGRR